MQGTEEKPPYEEGGRLFGHELGVSFGLPNEAVSDVTPSFAPVLEEQGQGRTL